MTGSREAASALRGRSAATVFETGHAQLLSPVIKPLDPTWAINGPAFTVNSGGGENIWIHRAVYQASAGDVLVVSTRGFHEFGYWGDILTTAAMERNLGGLVIDGCVRDASALLAAGFPVFARGLCVRGTGKSGRHGYLGGVVEVGGASVSPGDRIIADADGAVVVPAESAGAAAELARQRDDHEATVLERLRQGESTLGIYGWPAS